MKSVEGVKELLLDAALCRSELDVVDEEHVRLSISSAKTDKLVVLNGVNELVVISRRKRK